jgi:protein-S-isoprenylcysteine O-methyltransferase Ste14
MNPSIAIMDFNFFLGYGFPWSFIIIASGAFFIFTLIYQIINRKKLILKGPYKYSRHPQYFAIIIMTFSLTMISLNTGPIAPFSTYLDGNRILLFLIWIIETGAYILLAKIEEFWLKKKYGRRYSEYKINVSFMIPIKTIQKIFKNNGDLK